MLKIGGEDTFERLYTAKFRNYMSKYGEFVAYERDRAGRDIGVHLTYKSKSGGEKLSSSLCWFQLKGKMANTITKEQYDEQVEIKVRVRNDHLKFWYLQPMPTYIVVYVECVDTFHVMDMKKYIERRWGSKILQIKQNTTTLNVPKASILDEQAVDLILKQGEIKTWKSILSGDDTETGLCYRDFNLIYRINSAFDRKVVQKVLLRRWLSKLRSEIYFLEKILDEESDWQIIREHWEFMMGDFIEEAYPYIDFFDIDDDQWWDDDDESFYLLELSNGEAIKGHEYSGEYVEYELGFKLNEIGKKMVQWINTLVSIGIIDLDVEQCSYIDIAPWHGRSV